jgi:hypothetical protein
VGVDAGQGMAADIAGAPLDDAQGHGDLLVLTLAEGVVV